MLFQPTAAIIVVLVTSQIGDAPKPAGTTISRFIQKHRTLQKDKETLQKYRIDSAAWLRRNQNAVKSDRKRFVAELTRLQAMSDDCSRKKAACEAIKKYTACPNNLPFSQCTHGTLKAAHQAALGKALNEYQRAHRSVSETRTKLLNLRDDLELQRKTFLRNRKNIIDKSVKVTKKLAEIERRESEIKEGLEQLIDATLKVAEEQANPKLKRSNEPTGNPGEFSGLLAMRGAGVGIASVKRLGKWRDLLSTINMTEKRFNQTVGRALEGLSRDPVHSHNETVNEAWARGKVLNRSLNDVYKTSAKDWINKTEVNWLSNVKPSIKQLTQQRDSIRGLGSHCTGLKGLIVAATAADYGLSLKDVGQWMISTKILDVNARLEAYRLLERCEEKINKVVYEQTKAIEFLNEVDRQITLQARQRP